MQVGKQEKRENKNHERQEKSVSDDCRSLAAKSVGDIFACFGL